LFVLIFLIQLITIERNFIACLPGSGLGYSNWLKVFRSCISNVLMRHCDCSQVQQMKESSMKFRNCLVTVFCVLVLPMSAVMAQSDTINSTTETIPNHPALTDPFFIALGAYYPRSATTAFFSPSGGGTGIGIDFEDTLGLSEREGTLNMLARWRFGERWRLEFENFSLKRSATRSLAVDVVWGGINYTVGTEINTTFDITDTRLTVGYSFFKRKDKELGIGLGLHMTELNASLNAASLGESASDVLAPLPVVNFYGLFGLTDEWAVSVRGDWLSLSYDDYTGEIRSLGFDVLYQPFENIGFGLGTRTLTIDVGIDSPNWSGSANLIYQGPLAFVNVSF
jgi:hypothetical protein